MPALTLSLSLRGNLYSTAFDPATLFGPTDTGWFYDLSDMSTLFQDAAGTTPVTAFGQPMGLCLDKSKGLVLGPELVTNGTFDTDTNWIKETGWTISGGLASCDGSVQFSQLGQVNVAPQAKYFKVSFTLVSKGGSVTNLRVVLGGSFAGQINVSATGTYSGYFFNSGASSTFSIQTQVGTGAAFAVSIDNISVRELPGNHRSQSASLPRPTYARHPLGGIRNRLTFTEQFDNPAWAKTSLTVTANTHTAPDGTQTADTLTDASTGFALCSQAASIFSLTNTALLSIRKDSVGRATRFPAVRINYTGGTAVFFDLYLDTLTGEFITTAGGVGEVISDGDYWRVKLTATGNTGNTAVDMRVFPAVGASATWATSATAEGSIVAWGAYLGPVDGPYQRVRSVFDVTEAGVPDLYYLSYDGTDDFLSTAPFAWGTDKATVVAGVRKLSDAAVGILVETSPNAASNAGAFYITAPENTLIRYSTLSRGSAASTIGMRADIAASGVAPDTAVITAIHDIAGDLSRIRRNGIFGTDGTADKGTGNFGTYPVFFGARAGTSLFFRGNEYPSFGINRLLTANELSQLERWTAQRTGVTI